MGPRSENLRSVMGGPYAFVGDLHGRYRLLQGILDRDKDRKYHYVLLGDILHHKPFFKRHKPSSPLKILRMVSNLIEKGKGTLILGNNENYVLKSLIMSEKKIKKKELLHTLECLKSLEMSERLHYISMLSSAPLSLELPGNFRLAHAYYPHSGQNVTRDMVIFGPGYSWYRDEDLSKHMIHPAYQYFFGHYGLPYHHKNVHILDGTNLETTSVYYSDRDETVIYY